MTEHRDWILANRFHWMDKRVLFTILDQPFVELRRGTYWMKPSVSEEGLGLNARRIELEEIFVVQPEATGDYLNVDAVERPDGVRYRCWSGLRAGTFFEWFCYLGEGHRHMNAHQMGCVDKLLSYTPDNVFINVEFVGDTVIEAHARASFELEPMCDMHEEYSLPVYCIPVWAPPDGEPPAQKHLLRVPIDEDVIIEGVRRWALVFDTFETETEATAASRALNLWRNG